VLPALPDQLDRLVSLGWPALAGLSAEAFRARLAPVVALDVPGVLVVTRRLLDPHAAIAHVQLRGRTGFTSMDVAELASFVPLPSLEVPDVHAYVLLDPSPGADTLDVPPASVVLSDGRTPLTVEEGIAWVAQAPELLFDENCFSLSGSRRGDRRVPALWLSARRPRLGWCWQGAPHTWLGTASCAGRVGAGVRAARAG
jgi:hypothetical protein